MWRHCLLVDEVFACWLHVSCSVLSVCLSVCLSIAGLSILLCLELGGNTSAFAKSAGLLGSCEEHEPLARALTQLAEVEEKIDQLQQEQANKEYFVFGELLREYIGLIAGIKVSCLACRFLLVRDSKVSKLASFFSIASFLCRFAFSSE